MRLSRLAPSTKVKGRWLCYLEDGSLLRVTEHMIADFGLHAGMELTPALRSELDEAAERDAARDKALDLISLRPLSRKELVDKLTARPRDKERAPMPRALAEETAEWLAGLGYLNDGEYAKTVARHYSAKGYGAGKVRDELWKRGVPREYWDAGLAEAAEPEDGVDAFLRRKLKGTAPDRKELKRAADALARRGYRWDEIKDGLRRYGAEIDEE